MLLRRQVNEDWLARDDKGRQLDKGSVILADKYLIGLTQSGNLFLAEANPEEFRFLGQVPGVLSGGDCWARIIPRRSMRSTTWPWPTRIRGAPTRRSPSSNRPWPGAGLGRVTSTSTPSSR